MTDTWIVRVDTPAGFRKTYSFDSKDEAHAFIVGCYDKVVSGPTRVMHLTEEEDD